MWGSHASHGIRMPRSRALFIAALQLLGVASASAREPSPQAVNRLDQLLTQVLRTGTAADAKEVAAKQRDLFLQKFARMRVEAASGVIGGLTAEGMARSLLEEAKGPGVRGMLYRALADIYEALGSYAQLIETLGYGVAAFRSAGDARSELDLAMRLAEVQVTHSLAPENARRVYLRAAHLARTLGDTRAERRLQRGLTEWAMRASSAVQLLPGYQGAIDAFPFFDDLSEDGGALFVGPHGFLHLLREHGLARFDGAFLEHLPLPSGEVPKTAVALKNGRLLCGVADGLFLGTRAGWRHFSVPRASGVVAADPAGGAWVAVDQAVVHYDIAQALKETRREVRTFGGPNDVRSMTRTSAGDLYIVSRFGMEVVGPDTVSVHRTGIELPEDARLIVEDQGGSVWLLTGGGAIEYLNQEQVDVFHPEPLTHNPSVRTLLRDGNGRLWMGLGRGVARLDDSGVGLFLAKGDRYEQIYGLAEWPEGVIWFMNQMGQMVRIGAPAFTTYDRTLLPSGWIYEIRVQDDGGLLLMTGEGAARFHPNTLATLHYDDGDHCSGNMPVGLQYGEDQWLGASYGIDCVTQHDRKTAVAFRPESGLPSSSPEALVHFRGRPCVGMKPGVWCLEDREGGKEWLAPMDLSFFRYKSIIRRGLQVDGDGSLLVSVAGEGVYRVGHAVSGEAVPIGHDILTPPVSILTTSTEILLAGRNVVRQYQAGQLYALPNLPETGAVIAAARLSDNVLLLSILNKGVMVSDGEDWTLLSLENGLVSLRTVAILEDRRRGVVWLGTGGAGLTRMRWDHRIMPETFIVANDRAFFTDAQGAAKQLGVVFLAEPTGRFDPSLAVGDMALPAGVGEPKADETWLESTAGVFSMPKRSSLPIENDRRAEIGGSKEAVSLLGHLPAEAPRLQAAHRAPRLALTVSALTPHRALAPDRHWYRYRLDGGPWQALRHETSLLLEDLADGEHQLEVLAKGERLAADSTPAILYFRVDKPLPPWLWPLLVGSLVAVGLANRRRLLWPYQRWRYRKYRPIPDTLFLPGRLLPADGPLYGRERLVRETLGLLVPRGAQGASVIVDGEKGVGKSSLRKRLLAERRRDPSCITVEIDVEALATDNTVTAFVAGVRSSTATQLDTARVRVPELGIGDTETLSEKSAVSELTSLARAVRKNPYHHLDAFFGALLDILGDRSLLICFDNAVTLNRLATLDQVYGSHLLVYLRRLLQRSQKISLMFVLDGPRRRLGHEFAPIYEISTALAIGALPDADASEALRKLSDVYLGLHDRALETLLAAAGGNPLLLQKVGDAVAGICRKKATNFCDVATADAARAALVQDADQALSRWWGRQDVRTRQVLSAIAEHDLGHSLEGLTRSLTELHAPLFAQEVRREVDVLTDLGTVMRQGERYALRSQVQRLWIRGNQPLERVVASAQNFVRSYQILEKLGEGGMGTVYKVRHLGTQHLLALKVLRDTLRTDEIDLRRFRRESQIGLRLRHPNIVRLFDFGEHDGRAFIAMELLSGVTLARAMRQGRSFAWQEALALTRELARGLQAVHNARIVHRDLKSENIFLVPAVSLEHESALLQLPVEDIRPVLMDFGLAHGGDYTTVTKSGAIMGTLPYMSPEQTIGLTGAGQTSDIYSLGVILYEMLVGERPIKGSGLIDTMRRIAAGIWEVPSARCKGIPERVDQLVQTMMAVKPEMRPEGAGVVIKKIDQLLAQKS